MSNKNYRYTNLLSSYGFDGNASLETYPEERRNWRAAIKKHTDDAMGITDEQIAEGDSMTKRLNEAHEDINQHVTSEVTAAKENINSNIESAKSSIEGKIESSKTSIESKIESAKSSIEGKIAQVKQDTNTIVEWTRTHYWWNGN